ncbi:MAG TPA: hypothetical protein VK694_01920 [Verrucomicrobiae bacterium]|nr:hypothetical protein [Verrucomicrobiae bacterium]
MSSEVLSNPNHAPLSDSEVELRERLLEVGFQIIEDAPQNHVSYDIEGDGEAFALGSIFSWGGVAPSGDTFYDELRPLFPDKFTPSRRQFCEDHGLGVERLMDEGTDPQEATEKLVTWLNEQTEKTGKKPLMVGQAIAWDYSMTHAYFANYGIDDPFGRTPKPLDICGEAFAGVAGYDMKQTGKEDFPRFIWPDQEFPHQALEDSKIQGVLHAGVLALDATLRNSDLAQDLGLEPALRARGFEAMANQIR